MFRPDAPEKNLQCDRVGPAFLQCFALHERDKDFLRADTELSKKVLSHFNEQIDAFNDGLFDKAPKGSIFVLNGAQNAKQIGTNSFFKKRLLINFIREVDEAFEYLIESLNIGPLDVALVASHIHNIACTEAKFFVTSPRYFLTIFHSERAYNKLFVENIEFQIESLLRNEVFSAETRTSTTEIGVHSQTSIEAAIEKIKSRSSVEREWIYALCKWNVYKIQYRRARFFLLPGQFLSRWGMRVAFASIVLFFALGPHATVQLPYLMPLLFLSALSWTLGRIMKQSQFF